MHNVRSLTSRSRNKLSTKLSQRQREITTIGIGCVWYQTKTEIHSGENKKFDVLGTYILKLFTVYPNLQIHLTATEL